MTSYHPQEDGQCLACGGLEYATFPDGERARAKVCETCQGTCESCQGQGIVYQVDDSGYRFVRPCSCVSLSKRLEQYNRVQLPARYANKTLENFEEREESGVALKYELLKLRQEYKPGDQGMVLWGPPGTGKTHLITAFLSFLTLERGLSCRFVDFGDLTTRIKRGYDKGMSENEVIEDLVQVPILCVDELGKGRGSEWEISVLDALVNRRYNADRTTFFTTNFPLSIQEGGPGAGGDQRGKKTMRNPFNPKEVEVLKQGVGLASLEERVGSRIYSRLVEMCDLRKVGGNDYRRGKGA